MHTSRNDPNRSQKTTIVLLPSISDENHDEEMREAFTKLVDAGKAGHRGDIVPRVSDYER